MYDLPRLEMREGFQSKHIQEHLRASKERVAYLAMKIPITPEIDQVEGTGRAHLYSFRNFLQFSIAQHMGNLGFSLAEVRFVIGILDNAAEIFASAELPFEVFGVQDTCETQWDIDPASGKKVSVYIADFAQVKDLCENYYEPIPLGYDFKDKLFMIFSRKEQRASRIVDLTATITQGLKPLGLEAIGHSDSSAFAVINLGEIKRKLLFYIEEYF